MSIGALWATALWTSILGQSPILVLIPEAQTPEGCYAVERWAAAVRAQPEYRVVRARLLDDEDPEVARQRLGAALVVGGRRLGEAGAERYELHTQGPGGLLKGTASGRSLAAFASAARSAWPKDQTPLSLSRWAGIPGSSALDAACAGQGELALSLAGAAVGRSLPRLIPVPEAGAKGPLLARWGRASTLIQQGKSAAAIPLLRVLSAELEAGQLAPIWRRPPDPAVLEGAPPAAAPLQRIGELGIGVGAGNIFAFELATGETRWSLPIGPAQPVVAELEAGQLLVFLAKEVVGINANTGQVSFRAAFTKPNPEVAVVGGRVYLSEGEITAALDRGSGKVLWSYDGLVTPAAGPVYVAAQVVVPLSASLVFLDPESGAEKAKLKLGDELSAPLSVTAGGRIWALIGGDEVVGVDAVSHTVDVRQKDLPGIEWPPAVLGEQLVVSHKRGPQRLVSFLDKGAKSALRLTLKNAAPPVLALPDYSGILHLEERPPAVVARSNDGKVLWRQLAREKVVHLSLEADRVAFAAGKRVVILDRQKGRPLFTFELDEKISSVTLGPEVALALTQSGAVYGLPVGADPRIVDWPKAVRLELAEAYLATQQPAPAVALAKGVLDREPNNLEALALLATAKARVRPAEGAGELLRVLTAIGPNEPLARAARAELEARVGLLDLSGGEPGQKRYDGLVRPEVTTSTRGLIMPQARVRRATVVGERILYELEPRSPRPFNATWLFAIDRQTFRRAFEHLVPGRYRVQAGPEGWALIGEKQLRFLTAEGNLRPSANFATPIAEVALPGGGVLFVRTVDHLLAAVDGSSGLPRGRAQLGPLVGLTGADGQVAVKEAGGRVMCFDARRQLLPAK
ncbi:MAG: PQQ-binding-like beta-propeller repeat protein [Deltaproteobacteria bacterium]|nr:PQQ-binding-like beta-propeller repeat protein [Deltaproteobacteria bacterium]